MELFLSTFLCSLRRALWNIKFPLCVLCITLLLFISAGSTVFGEQNAITVIAQGMSASSLICICVIPIIPYGTSFAEEWRDNASRYIIIRSSTRNYTTGKVLAAALSGFLTLFLSIILAAFILSFWMPLSRIGSIGDAYSVFINNNKPVLYILFYSMHLSCSAALFAILGLWISAYIPNTWNAVAFPVVIYIFSLRFIPILGMEVNLLWVNLVDSIYDMGTPFASLLFKVSIVTLLCILLGMDTVRRVRKRVIND